MWILPSSCKNKGAHSACDVAWEVLNGTISCEQSWEIMPTLCFYRDPDELIQEEQAAAENTVTQEEFQGERTATEPKVSDWCEGLQVPSAPIHHFLTEDGNSQLPLSLGCSSTAQATEWVRTTSEWCSGVLPRFLSRKWK